MITRIEIDGFKTFREFSVDLAPFQVIIGANGCGKSNLFDAIHLLSLLADHNVNEAFQSVRGDAQELFTQLPDGKYVEEMLLNVEMLVDPTVRDEWGNEPITLEYRKLHYHLGIGICPDETGSPRLCITSESLWAISKEMEVWAAQRVNSDPKARFHNYPSEIFSYIDSISDECGHTIIRFKSDRKGIKSSLPPQFQSGLMERTLLSRVETTEYPHVLSARQEIQKWSLLRLNLDDLRKPSTFLNKPPLTIIGALPATLARIQRTDKHHLADISRDMQNLVPNLSRIEVIRDEARQEYLLYVHSTDGRRFSPRVLSDGTLRMLALMTMRNDPAYKGVLCFEEPEEGVHPGTLKGLVRRLRGMTTELGNAEREGEPLRQLLITTHSPELVSHLEIEEQELLYAEMVTRIEPGVSAMKVTRMTPVGVENLDDKAAKVYTVAQVLQYLGHAEYKEARTSLKKAID